MASFPRGHARLLGALKSAGYRTETHERGDRLVVVARHPEGGGFSLYLGLVESQLGREGIARPARLPGGRTPAWERDLTKLALDYLPGDDLYIPARRRRYGSPVAFRPDAVGAFLASLEDERREAEERGRARGPAREEIVQAFEVDIEAIRESSLFTRILPAAEGEAQPIQTGFYEGEAPYREVDPGEPLEPASEYRFWFGAGFDTDFSIEREDVPLPDDVPTHARLAVEVFSFEGELALAGPCRGEFEVTAERGLRVVVPALEIEGRESGEGRRLAFPVRTPKRPGTHRLRCNLYLGSTLLQSRLVSARIGGRAEEGGRALESVLDYRLSSSLGLADLARVPAHDLSLSINGNEATHQFRIYSESGEEAFRSEASLSSAKVNRAIEVARTALRRASWGKSGEWNGKLASYRYGGSAVSRAQLTADLADLARAGARLYSILARDLSGNAREQLEAITGTPLTMQIASGRDGLYIPAGLFFDHTIDPARPGVKIDLCKDFAQALQGSAGKPLEQATCMVAGCQHRADGGVVCPSGFWGFRHEIGWPTSSAKPVTEISCEGEPRVLIGVSTDPGLSRRRGHVQRLKRMSPGGSALAETLDGFDVELKKGEAQVVYLYCHGGVEEEEVYAELGQPKAREWVTFDHLRQRRPWGEPPPRALVFINGCHTTAVSPSEVLDLVSGFVEEADAAGVIGTEVTVFERLACEFAEEMLPGFLGRSRTVGSAIRHARLELLRARNPLGLVYVPFIAAGTRLGR